MSSYLRDTTLGALDISLILEYVRNYSNLRREIEMTQTKKKERSSCPFPQMLIKLHAIKSKALDVYCYRGFAKLCDLAKISNADEYHPTTNPNGIQRELKKKNDREAYNYASKEIPWEKRIWPEIILNLRNKDGVKIESGSPYKHMPRV